MARFDVYANPSNQSATTPYLLDIQSDLLDGLDSRVVIPLRRLKDFPNVKISNRLTPIIKIGREDYLLETPKMGAIPTRLLKTPVQSIANKQTEIISAMDFLFHGF